MTDRLTRTEIIKNTTKRQKTLTTLSNSSATAAQIRRKEQINVNIIFKAQPNEFT